MPQADGPAIAQRASPASSSAPLLYQNRYFVDAGRVHIKVCPHTTPTPPLRALLTACPARCAERQGRVEITADGCVECGTCRIIGSLLVAAPSPRLWRSRP